MTLPEIEAEIARLTDEVNRLTTLRDEMVSAQIRLDIEQGLADPEIRAAYAQAIKRLERETVGLKILHPGGEVLVRSPASPEHLEWLARHHPLAGAALLLIYRDITNARSRLEQPTPSP